MTTSSLASAPATSPGTRGWLPAFVTLAAIWGASFVLIKVGIRELAPMHLTLYRCAAGALTLLVVVVVTRVPMIRDARLWGHLAVIALIGNVIPFTLFGYGERYVSSVVAGIWNATTPLMVLVVALAVLPDERPNRWRVAGLLVGFAGVMVVLGVWQGLGGAALLGQLLCAGAAACYGLTFPYMRRVTAGRSESGVAFAAAQLIAATLELAVLAPLLAGAPPTPMSLSPLVLGAALGLGALGTGIAFVLNYRVLRLGGATTAASVTYLIPVFSTGLGVLVLGELLHWYELAGALVILAGVAMSQLGGSRLGGGSRLSGSPPGSSPSEVSPDSSRLSGSQPSRAAAARTRS